LEWQWHWFLLWPEQPGLNHDERPHYGSSYSYS